MNRIFLGALAACAVFALTSFAIRTAGSPTAPPPGGPAWTVSQYQLDRAFRTEIDFALLPMTLPMPATGGIIITQLKLSGSNCAATNVTVNSVAERFDFGGIFNSPAPWVHDLNPPIIVKPGQVMSIAQAGPSSCPGTRLTVAGYTTLPGET